MSGSRRGIPFIGRADSRRDAARSKATERMDLLLQRAEQDAAEQAFEPPSISPWSSPDGEPELHETWQSKSPDFEDLQPQEPMLGETPLDDFSSDRMEWQARGDELPAWDEHPHGYEGFSDGEDPENRAAGAPPHEADDSSQPSPIDIPTLLRGNRGAKGRDSERNVLPFRRRSQQRRIRRLRRHPFVRWMGPLAMAIGILAVPLAVLGWFFASPSYTLQEVIVIGDDLHRVDPSWVRGTLGGFENSNLWLLPLDRAEVVLFQHPWIEDVALRKQPPHDLEVRIIERREAALYRDPDQGLIYVDSKGRRIAPWSTSKDSGDLPILSGKGETSHLASAVALVNEINAAAPPWAAGLSEVEILSEIDYRLYTRDLPFPLLVRSGTVDQKARHLQTLLPRILDRFHTVGAVDLRFARRIIIEPVDSGSRRS